MRLGLLFVLAAIPFLEIALLIKVGQSIGFGLTFLLVAMSALLGSYVIYEQGLQVMGRAMEAMSRGKTPLAPVIDGMFILLGGVLLILPGFLSDILGLALLVPPLRRRIAVWSFKRVLRSANVRTFVFGEKPQPGRRETKGSAEGDGRSGSTSTQSRRTASGEGPIIDGEFERLDERTVDRGSGRDRPPPKGP